MVSGYYFNYCFDVISTKLKLIFSLCFCFCSHQRTGDEPIPGCIGMAATGEDYCRYPELTYVGNPPPTTLGNCEGDCDTDSDCGPNLECFQRPGTEKVSGCLGTGTSGTDYCALRLTPNTLFLKGNNGSPSYNFPLGLCEGGKRFN